MSSNLAVVLGALITSLVVSVVLVWYLEVRLGAVVERFDDLYVQLEMVFWKLENR